MKVTGRGLGRVVVPPLSPVAEFGARSRPVTRIGTGQVVLSAAEPALLGVDALVVRGGAAALDLARWRRVVRAPLAGHVEAAVAAGVDDDAVGHVAGDLVVQAVVMGWEVVLALGHGRDRSVTAGRLLSELPVVAVFQLFQVQVVVDLPVDAGVVSKPHCHLRI